MPRAALLFEFPSLHGGERSLLALVEPLRARDWSLTALAPPTGPLAGALAASGIAHVPFAVRDAAGHRRPRPELHDELHAHLQDLAPDLLHANSLAMGILSGTLGERLPVPSTAHLRDIVRLSPAQVAALNSHARLVAVSRAVRDFHVAQGLDPDRVDVVYNGIDAAQFGPHRRTGTLRSARGLSDEAVLIGTIGQIGLRKGLDVWADAAVRLLASGRDFHAVVVGARHSTKAESVAFEAAFAERFATAGFASRRHLLGERTDVPDLLAELDLLVHPARQEPFGRVLLEAAASGVPIVATDAGGTREMLENERSALLVPPGDARRLADAVARVLDDPSEAARRAEAAGARIVQEFPVERAALGLDAAWRRVLRDIRL
jgi:glycosyltransferase involved in cell wall biosynthesis